MDNMENKNPFDQKPKRKLSDYILDDLDEKNADYKTEKKFLNDLPFNTEDNEEIDTRDIKICTDPAGAFFMKPEGETASGLMDDGNISSKISGANDVTSRFSDVDNLTGIANTLPKEQIEVLSLAEDELAKENLSNHNSSNEDRKVKPSKTTSNKHVIALVALGALFMMWYTTFAQPLAFNVKQKQIGHSNDGIWDIRFTDMYQKRKIGDAREISSPSYMATKASFHVSLANPGDEITYNLTIKNSGTLNAKVAGIHIMPENKADDAILYYVNDISVGDFLDAGQSTNMTVIAKFNENATVNSKQVKNVSVIINYIQR